LVQDAGFRLVSVRAEMGEANFAAAEDLPRGYGAMAGLPTDVSTRAAAINDVTAALASYVGRKACLSDPGNPRRRQKIGKRVTNRPRY